MLAVNQNGRWAPHLSWMREAVRAGLIGEVQSVDVSIHWDHGWIEGTRLRGYRRPDPLRLRRPLVRFPGEPDRRPRNVGLRRDGARAGSQEVRPPMLAEALVAFDGGQAVAHLRRRGPLRRGGSHRRSPAASARLNSRGPDLGDQEVTLTTEAGIARPKLEGTWFKEGFRGTMGALLEGGGGRHAATQRRPRQPRCAGAGLRRDRLGPRSACRSRRARSAASPRRRGDVAHVALSDPRRRIGQSLRRRRWR